MKQTTILSRPAFIGLAALILLSAAFLRLYLLPTYPPGPHYDEGAYLLITRAIANGARFFPIVEAYQGREVLYMYLNAPLLAVLGDHMLTLRLSSAWIGLLTVAATIALGRLMFRGRMGVIVGLSAGLLIALSYPQFWLGRQAFRAITLPLMQALALALLWRGLRSHRRPWGWLTVAGVFAGGALYTYMASRLFPVWLGVGGLVLLAADHRRWRYWLPRVGVFFGVMTVVALPMIVYAVQKPDIFFGRLNEVTQAGQSVTVWQSILLHARMFFVEGDSYFRYNIPGRPYLTPLEGLALLAGLGVAVWMLIRRYTPPSERMAAALAALSPLMVIPSVISVGGLPPSHMRSLGMIPLLFILCGIGIAWAWERLPARFARPTVFASLIVGVLVVGVPFDWTIYQRWAASAEVYYETNADLDSAGRWLTAGAGGQLTGQTVIYIGTPDRGHPTLDTLPTPPLTYIGTDSLFRPPPGRTGIYIFPHTSPPAPVFADWLAAGRITNGLPIAPDSRPAFIAYALPADTPLPAHRPPAVPVTNGYLTLIGAALMSGGIQAGEGGLYVTYWQVDSTPPHDDFTPLVEVRDPAGALIARADAYVTGAAGWLPGSILMQAVRITPPASTPPGSYTVQMGWVGRSADVYAQYRMADGSPAGIWTTTGPVEITRPASRVSVAALDLSVRLDATLTPGVVLAGISGLPTLLRPGEALPFDGYWVAAESDVLPRDVPVSIALIAEDEASYPLLEAVPLAGRYSPSAWQPGDVWRESFAPLLPRNLPAGLYSVRVAGSSGDAMIGTVMVEGIARRITPDAMDRETGITFDDMLFLHGVTLTDDAVNGATLHAQWRSERATATAYTAFVHRVDAAGQIVDQVDDAGAYPVSLWMPGEYVTTHYRFPADARVVGYRIGWYDVTTGVRLPVTVENGALAAGITAEFDSVFISVIP